MLMLRRISHFMLMKKLITTSDVYGVIDALLVLSQAQNLNQNQKCGQQTTFLPTIK